MGTSSRRPAILTFQSKAPPILLQAPGLSLTHYERRITTAQLRHRSIAIRSEALCNQFSTTTPFTDKTFLVNTTLMPR